MATLKMSGCMKLVSKMSDADQDALLARLDQYQSDGVPADRAQFMAAQDMLAEIQGERDSLFGLLQEQHPDLFTVSEEPAVQLSRAREQTETPEFKRWFGESKVVDGRGRPLVVYHGTGEDVAAFDPRRIGANFGEDTASAGFYFIASPKAASQYAESNSNLFKVYPRMGKEYRKLLAEEYGFVNTGYYSSGNGPTKNPNVLPVYLSLQNPLIKNAIGRKSADQSIDFMVDQWKQEAIEGGHDGLIIRATGGYKDRGDVYVAFRPEQIKSAIGNSGAFDPANPDIRFSRARTPLGFYSALADSVDGIKTNSAPAQGWKDAIKGLVNKGQVKADEVEWSGVNDWLDLQQGKVSRDAVLAYLQQGGVQVEETVLRDSGDEIPFLDNAAKYSQYTLPGGENYREVLLTLPAKKPRMNYRVFANGPVEQLPDVVDFDTREAAEAELARRRAAQPRLEHSVMEFEKLPKDGGTATYRSSHWDQPNVLAHIRVNDRADADGKRVLFVEELQSDWGQEGKKKGFRNEAELAKFKTELKNARDRRDAFEADMLKGIESTTDEEFDKLLKEQQRLADAVEAAAIAYDSAGRDSDIPTAPFVTKTEGWLNLALKRVMVMAAEGGYDKVAFVNGEQSAGRYDLSKQIDRIDAKRKPNGMYELDFATKDGRDFNRDLNEAELEANVGKEMAKKIVDATQEPNKRVRFSGLDLKVGGEGMKAFYDTIVPTALKKLLPKVGGGQMGVVTIDQGGNNAKIGAPDEAWPFEVWRRGRVINRHATRANAEMELAEFRERDERAGEVDPTLRIEQVLDTTSQQPGFDVTDAMRAKLEEGVPMFSRARPSVGVGRDELGYTNFGIGAMAYERASTIANNVLDALSNKTGGLVAFKPIDPKLNRAIRKMRVELEKTQNLTANVAQQLKDIPEDERKMISDVIEGELKVGVVPPQRVLQLAASMSQIMSQQSAELVRLGMLTPEAAQRWDNKYLPRFYEQKLGDEVKAWAKAAKTLFGRTRAMAGIRGNSLKARGMFETIDVAELANWQAQGWEIRDADYDPATSTDVRIWRDYTRDERDNMGEIRDAMFRFVMGYMNSQRDVALGRLYERLEADVASRTEKPGYVLVPKTLVEDTVARRYGKLAGRWVPREVMDHLSALDSSTDNQVFQLYKKGLAKWKEGKTVLNPVAHANNIISNLTMAHFAGVSYWDAGKYAGATRDLMRNSVLVTEAKDAGLFGGTFNRAELVDELPPQLRMLAGMTESKLAKGAETVWNAMSFFLNKPLGKAYDAEDKFFRFLIYREARNRGLDIDDSVDYAQRFIFTYDNLPKGARAVRDFGLPFFGYTYKVVPVLLQTAMEHPLRYAAPAAILTAANAAMYALASAADEDDDWAELLKRYVTDAEFRKKAQAMEADERKNLPEWMKGRSGVLGTPKTVRLWEDTVTGLPMFLDVSRMIPSGDLFDMNNQTGGLEIPQPLMPGNPLLTTIVGVVYNLDTFRGKTVTDKNDTSEEKTAKLAPWIWKQLTPAIAVGNYHFNRSVDAIANATGRPIDLGLGEYTGIGRDGLPVQPGLAALQTVGIKARPIDLEMSEKISRAERERTIKELQAEIRQLNRLENRGAMTPEAAEQKRELQREKIQRLREGLTVEGTAVP